jgi:nicotinamide-nucleotide amidase
VTGNPTLAFNASGIEGIKVRITAKAASTEEAAAVLAAEEEQLRSMLGASSSGPTPRPWSTPWASSWRRRA